MKSINPATGEVLAEYQAHTPQQIDEILCRSQEAYRNWRSRPIPQKAELLLQLARTLEEQKEELAKLMTLEMGKPIQQARLEIAKCASGCRYYAENAEQFLAPEPVAVEGARAQVVFDPIGIVLGIMPWNFPFWQVFRFAVPCLLAGNVAVMKHASNVTGCALAIEKVFLAAGFPEGVFQVLKLPGREVAAVLRDSRVVAVSLTGSTKAGQEVAREAGSLIKKTVLELGGSDPYIILADANIQEAAKSCAISRLQNAGQSCIAAKRFLVQKPVAEEFLAAFVHEFRSRKVGDPLLEETDVGPLAGLDFRSDLERQVQIAMKAGAKLVCGGRSISKTGAFFEPTILRDMTVSNPIFTEEVFGPVAAVYEFDDLEEALQMANGTCFGLGAAIFSADVEKAQQLSRQINSGSVFINDFVRSDPRLPFGGQKQSGVGRELSHYGIREFINIKSVLIKQV